MEKDYKIAILGNDDAVAGFKAVGVTALGVKTVEQGQEKLQAAYEGNDYAIIFITEDWFDKLQTVINTLPPKALPALVAIPSQAGSTGAGLRSLKKIVEQAVGSDILADR